MSHGAFNLLARPIQHILWDMGWEALRPIQADSIHQIIEHDCDLIISARTAAGKTEAAFLPILSMLYENRQPSIQALYVGPLKALINDQFRRLEDLCSRAGITVHRWHGDVDRSRKQRLLDAPAGVLLITPESIESLFVNRSTYLSRLFQHVGFVVIDEIHALVGRERGIHLRSLLFRLGRFIQGDFRLVGLSATLGDALPTYAEWMRPGRSDRVVHVHDPIEQKRVLYRIQAYTISDKRSGRGAAGKKTDDDTGGLPPLIIEDMHGAFAGKKNLVFANNRQNVESFADSLNDYCRRSGMTAEFLVHHGSLSKEVREHTELAMRGRRPHTTLCSSTLELGIDIGNVASVGQIGAPWSVSSLVQRLGRSGRGEGEAQAMRLYVVEQRADARSSLVDRLYPDLLRAIALTELMLQKWVEPPGIDELDLSTLVQQILSVLAQTGGINAEQLYQTLVVNGAFREVDQELFIALLRGLGTENVIEQMSGGDLILTPQGESIVGHYTFYSAFATPIEYSVICEGRPIGRLPAVSVPEVHDHLLLAARRWEVVRVDHERTEILVVPARGRKPPHFSGEIGEIHPRVRQTMRQVLISGNAYPYIDEMAQRLLDDARQAASSARLSSCPLVPLATDECLWFTWTGTTIQRTLCLMARVMGMDPVDDDIAIHFSSSCEAVMSCYRELLVTPPSAITLARRIRAKRSRKFDWYVAEPLLIRSLARDAIDVAGACDAIRDLVLTR